MNDGDAIFDMILTQATEDELNSPTPPMPWLTNWTPENGCTRSMDHAREHWNDMRVHELAKRQRARARGEVAFNHADPLAGMPWKTTAEAADAMGYTRAAIYKWKAQPDTMPLAAKRLLAFFMMAPPTMTAMVIKSTIK